MLCVVSRRLWQLERHQAPRAHPVPVVRAPHHVQEADDQKCVFVRAGASHSPARLLSCHCRPLAYRGLVFLLPLPLYYSGAIRGAMTGAEGVHADQTCRSCVVIFAIRSFPGLYTSTCTRPPPRHCQVGEAHTSYITMLPAHGRPPLLDRGSGAHGRTARSPLITYRLRKRGRWR